MRAGHALVAAVLLVPGVSPGDDAPAAADLRKVQPPGGVPLRPEKPGGGISPDYLRQAEKRLAAAPGEALDRWVAELERITGKRFDGLLERQACRTEFVTRVSVAFDGLAWNAPAADALLARARTLTPAEAKEWTDAFEAVLGREIDRVYTVPLVLVPVAALYDGPAYSPGRGRKYLTRLRQLTADDVARWRTEVDRFEGTDLDAAVNLVLLDGLFDRNKFRRDRFRAATAAKR